MAQSAGKAILDAVGGESNVQSVDCCTTRLSFELRDKDKVNKNALENIEEVMSIVDYAGHYQVVIGTKANVVYGQLLENTGLAAIHEVDDSVDPNERIEKKNPLSFFTETVSALFTPILPLLAGSGVLRGIVLLLTQVGWLSIESSTYVILTCASTAVFYFLPLLLAYTGAKKFKCSPYVSVAIMGALIMPSFVDLMGDAGTGVVADFIGIPVVLMTYSSTVIPAVFSIYVYSKLEKVLTKLIPQTLQLCFVPLISLLVMVPLTAAVIGPLGVYLGDGIATIVTQLVSFNGWVAGAIVSGVWNILVIFGINWAVNPIMIQNIGLLGYDYIVPFTAAANFGIAGATFGVFLRTKDAKMRAYSMSALLSIFFAGITEPAIYGIGVRYKKPLISAFVGGALGGAFMGGMGVKAYAFVFGGLTTIPAFAGPTLVFYLIGLVICFVGSTIVQLIIGVDDETAPNEAASTQNALGFFDKLKGGHRAGAKPPALSVRAKAGVIYAPVDGKTCSMAELPDPVFSSGVMGQAVGIWPSDNGIYAPVSGTLTAAMPHAFGITNEDGYEILVHVGVDTVQMNGDGFELLVHKGDHVAAGQPLLTFDRSKIADAGYDDVVIVVLLNSGEAAPSLRICDVAQVHAGDQLVVCE